MTEQHPNSRLQCLELLASQRWPVYTVSATDYANLYMHHENLISALQLVLQSVPDETLAQVLNGEIICSTCDNSIPGIPTIREGLYYCNECYTNLFADLPLR